MNTTGTQLGMFASTPASRSTDPSSSHAAESELNRTGQRASQQHRVLSMVRRWPGRTSRELAALANVDRYMVARRLPELAPHKIQRGAMKLCQVSKRKAVTWLPIERNGTGSAA